MDFVIKNNKNVYIRLSENGKAETCKEKNMGKFTEQKAKNILKSLPKTLKIVNETIMGLNFFDQWKRNAMQLGKFLNENATKEMFNKFNEYLDRLYNIVTPTTGKLFSEKNALIWFMLFDRFDKTGYPDEKFGEFLNDFEKLKNVKVVVEHTMMALLVFGLNGFMRVTMRYFI